jgi:hypothetical protein
MNKGFCKICGNEGILTLEHIPPKSTFNKNTRYKSILLLDYLTLEDPLNVTISGKTYQGGTGFHSLCKKCNNFLGTQYVNPYVSFVKSLSNVVFNNPNNHFVVEIRELHLLRILKQIISMFISINMNLRESHPELIEFVRDENLNYLPNNIKIFVYLNTEGNLRHLPLMVKGNFGSNISIYCSEITFPPLGYVLSINHSSEIQYLTEITNFKNFSLNELTDIKLDMYKLPTYFPIHLDYRNFNEIKDLQ